jgi:hypothetical protein
VVAGEGPETGDEATVNRRLKRHRRMGTICHDGHDRHMAPVRGGFQKRFVTLDTASLD